jgi:hypothetical protein
LIETVKQDNLLIVTKTRYVIDSNCKIRWVIDSNCKTR